ncbi:MAG: hypothetical protein ACKV2O_15810 [Acidimicrobiales bacterium]
MRRLVALLITLLVVAACGDGSQQGLRRLVDEVQAVRATAQQGDLTSAREQIDELRVTAGVLRGRGRISSEELVDFQAALDRVETELVATQQSLLMASASSVSASAAAPPTTTAVTAVTTTTPTTTTAPPSTEPPPDPDGAQPGKRKGQDDDD